MKRFTLLSILVLAMFGILAQTPPDKNRPVQGQASPLASKQLKLAAPSVSITDGFDKDDMSKWFPIGTTTKIQRKNDAGGYLSALGFMGRDGVGVFTTDTDLTGAFTHPASISLDLRLSVQQRSDYRVILILQRDSASRYWYHLIPNPSPTQWTRVNLNFSPSWSDDQARSEGWILKEGGARPHVSWQETMKHYYRIGILAEIPNYAATANFMTIMDLDNISVTK